MMYKTNLYTLLLLCITACYATAQQQACDKIVVDCMMEMKQYQEVKPGRVYFLETHTESRYRKNQESKNQNYTSKIYLTSDKMYYETPMATIFSDSLYTYMAVHGQKVVIRAGAYSRDGGERMQLVSAIQDSLLRHSRLSSCTDTELEGRKVKEIVYTTDQKFRQATGVASQAYYYDVAGKKIFRSVTRYVKESEKEVDIHTYYKIDLNHHTMPVQSVQGWLFGKDGSVLPRYRNYELIDNK